MPEHVDVLMFERRRRHELAVDFDRRAVISYAEDGHVVTGLSERSGFLDYARITAERGVSDDEDAGAHVA